MEFWGVEVKPGESVKVDQVDLIGAEIHLSQIALGEAKKGKSSEPVVLYLKVGEQKLVLGTLNRDNIPQILLDVYLDSEFELSHTSKDASVYFIGQRQEDDEPFEGSDDFSESDDEHPVIGQDNGKPETEAGKAKVPESKKAVAGAPAKQVKIVDPKKVEEDDSDDESDDDFESDNDDESGSPDEMDADSDEDSESDEDEETPAKKVDQGKKRPNESASKTPVSTKKVKNATPEKTDGKKNAHIATPHPMKKGGKTPNSAGKGKSPNSGGQHKKSKHGAK